MKRLLFSILGAATFVNLLHETSGPAGLFEKLFIFLDTRREERGGIWIFWQELLACPRCLSVWVGVILYLAFPLLPVRALISGFIASKVVDLDK